MQKSKNTKRSLLASILAMMLCVAMLVCSTFAWFTDSVTSANNQIVAGNLDVELYHSNANVADEKVTSETKLFTVKDGESILWEPGAMVYENLTVKNAGSLALKYKLNINVGDFNTVNGKSLKDVLKVAILDDATFTGNRSDAQALTFDKTVADFEKDGELITNGSEDAYAIVIYWEPSENDNDYNLNNGKESSDGEALYINLGVVLEAYQDTVESDAFDNNYDKKAWPYPEKVATVEALQSAIANGGDIKLTESMTWNPALNNIAGNSLFNVEENGTVNIDFANNELTIDSDNGRDVIKGAKGAILTLSNGEIVANKSYSSSYPVVGANYGTVVLDKMSVSVPSGVAVSAGSGSGKLIIKDSTITGPNSTYSNAVFVGSGATAVIENSIINGTFRVENNGKLIIKSGTFSNDPGVYVDSNSEAVKNADGTWTVTVK